MGTALAESNYSLRQNCNFMFSVYSNTLSAKRSGPKGSNKFSVNMCQKIYSTYLVYSKVEKNPQHDSDWKKEKAQKKTTFENDSDDTW